MMAYFHCCGTSPPRPTTNDDIEQSPAQGGITVEGDLEQLNGDFVRPDSLSGSLTSGWCNPIGAFVRISQFSQLNVWTHIPPQNGVDAIILHTV